MGTCEILLMHCGFQVNIGVRHCYRIVDMSCFMSYTNESVSNHLHTCDNESEVLPITQQVSALYFSSETHFAAKSANSTRISCQILVNACIQNWLEKRLCSWASLAFYNVCDFVLTILAQNLCMHFYFPGNLTYLLLTS